MKNEKIIEAYDSIQPNVDVKNHILERIIQRQVEKRPRKRLISIAAAIVILLAVSTAAFVGIDWFPQRFNQPIVGMDWFTQQFNQPLADIVEPSNQDSEVPPAEKWQGVEIIALNPLLDPVDTRSTIVEYNIVVVIFVFNEYTSSFPPRDLVISTPGSFTIPVPDAVNLDSSVSFVGWRDLHGNLWIAGTLIGWDVEVSGTLTLTAEWS